ncbi:MAG: helix-turn-helix transcriptional regulator [Candidatus Paceibacterota bacterium]|jgi:transcriptional regulator with XRE-family HTH domain
MYSFPKLIKKIRGEAGLTQAELAKALGVSTVLIVMIENGQKRVSKKLIIKLARLLKVHPSSITPFIFSAGVGSVKKFSALERGFICWGEKMQTYLIKKRAKLLKRYAGRKIS